MKMLAVMTSSALMLMTALPAHAQDGTNSNYPLKMQTAVTIGDLLPLNVELKQHEEFGVRQFKVSDATGAYTGTGNSFEKALRSLQNDYIASGQPEGPLPESITYESRIDGPIATMDSKGSGDKRVRRFTLANAPGLVFVVHEWATTYQQQEIDIVASFKYVPTPKAGEMLVVNTAPDEDEDVH